MDRPKRISSGEALRYDRHPLRHWFYGHFHHSWNAEINGVNYTMLGIMEMKELRGGAEISPKSVAGCCNFTA